MSLPRNKEYRDVRARDVPHNELEGEVSESLMGHGDEEETRSSSEKTWAADHEVGSPRARRSGSRKCISAMWTVRSLVDTALLVFIVVLLLDKKWGNSNDNDNNSTQRYGQYEGNGEISGFAPIMSQKITTFVPDPGFAPENTSEFFTDAVRKKWLSIVPKGLGYVKIENPEKYNNLPTPLKTYSPATFTTSVTHQLHCLHAILSVYSGITSNNTHKMNQDGPWHLTHCFEYLRQSIMCCGDTALEGQQTTFPPGFVGSDGWDAKHVCKDYSQVKGYLEENRQNDMTWI